MKKTCMIIAMFCFMIIFMGNVTILKATSPVELSIDSKEGVKRGETITLNIKIQNVQEQTKKIVGLKFDIYYDINNFEFVSASKLDAASGTIDLNENYPGEGRVRVGIVSLMGLSKSGDLYELKLKVKENITKNVSEIKIETKEVIDGENNEIPVEIKNGNIKFEGYNTTSEINTKEDKQEEDSNKANKENQNSDIENTDEKIQESNQISGEQKNGIILSNQENKNIKDILKEDSRINKDTKISYKIENTEIAEIDEEGNIKPKQEGTTNIEITDEEGNTVILPLTVTESNETIQSEDKEKSFVIYIIIFAVSLILAIFIILKKKKQKINYNSNNT